MDFLKNQVENQMGGGNSGNNNSGQDMGNDGSNSMDQNNMGNDGSTASSGSGGGMEGELNQGKFSLTNVRHCTIKTCIHANALP